MPKQERFSFIEQQDSFGITDTVPQLPLKLKYSNVAIDVTGLLDTGASVSVLPYSMGRQLGAIWEEQKTSVMLAGNLAPVEARGLVVSAEIGNFSPVRLVFAWSKSDNVPLLLGRMNFFLEFDVCFYQSEMAFELRQK